MPAVQPRLQVVSQPDGCSSRVQSMTGPGRASVADSPESHSVRSLGSAARATTMVTRQHKMYVVLELEAPRLRRKFGDKKHDR